MDMSKYEKWARSDGAGRQFSADAQFEFSLFTPYDFLQIENVLYSPREEEMLARKLFKINTSYAPYAKEIGYDFYTREGSAAILADGANAGDVPYVSEHGGRVTNYVYDIASGIRYTRKEREAVQAKRALGKGPAIDLDTLRISSVRRFILEQENKCAFVGAKGTSGASTYKIVGALDSTFYDSSGNIGKKESVATGTGGYLWSQKTAVEILTDLLTAVKYVEKDGLFKARVLVLPPAQYTLLRQPYSALNPMTLLDWLNSQGMYFEQIVSSRVMRSDYNGDGTYDFFMVLDNDPEVIQLALTYDVTMLNPVYDELMTMKQVVMEGFGGVLFRHPAGAYIGYRI
jgi:hypothetical protein